MDYQLNDKERARMDAAVDRIRVTTTAKGWNVSDDDIRSLPSVRLFALTSESLDPDQWQSELRGLESVGAAIQKQEEREQLRAAIDAGTGESAIEKQLAGMNGPNRIAKARELGIATPKTEASRQKMSIEEQAMAINRLLQLPAGKRISEARRLGIEV